MNYNMIALCFSLISSLSHQIFHAKSRAFRLCGSDGPLQFSLFSIQYDPTDHQGFAGGSPAGMPLWDALDETVTSMALPSLAVPSVYATPLT